MGSVKADLQIWEMIQNWSTQENQSCLYTPGPCNWSRTFVLVIIDKNKQKWFQGFALMVARCIYGVKKTTFDIGTS